MPIGRVNLVPFRKVVKIILYSRDPGYLDISRDFMNSLKSSKITEKILIDFYRTISKPSISVFGSMV